MDATDLTSPITMGYTVIEKAVGKQPPKPPSEKFTPSKRAKHMSSGDGGGGYAGGNRTKRQYKKRKTQRRVRSKK
mgnify:CR=1 FL=1